jgi:hypothetical protein
MVSRLVEAEHAKFHVRGLGDGPGFNKHPTPEESDHSFYDDCTQKISSSKCAHLGPENRLLVLILDLNRHSPFVSMVPSSKDSVEVAEKYVMELEAQKTDSLVGNSHCQHSYKRPSHWRTRGLGQWRLLWMGRSQLSSNRVKGRPCISNGHEHRLESVL